jgi:hypothetical protein
MRLDARRQSGMRVRPEGPPGVWPRVDRRSGHPGRRQQDPTRSVCGHESVSVTRAEPPDCPNLRRPGGRRSPRRQRGSKRTAALANCWSCRVGWWTEPGQRAAIAVSARWTSSAVSSRSLRDPSAVRIGARTFSFFFTVLADRPSKPSASQSCAARRTDVESWLSAAPADCQRHADSMRRGFC